MTEDEMLKREDANKARVVNQIGIARRKRKCLEEKATEFIQAIDHWRGSLASKVEDSEYIPAANEDEIDSKEYPDLETLKGIMREIDENTIEILDCEEDLRKWDVIG